MTHAAALEGHQPTLTQPVDTQQVGKVQTCILALKVFDWCIKPISFTDCFPIPPECSPPVPPGSTVECRVVSVTTTIISVRPAPPPAPPGTKTVTVRVDITKELTIFNPPPPIPPPVRCTFQVTSTLHESTSLFAPDGTTVQVEATAECGPCDVNGEGTIVCCEQGVCLQFESKAPVKLCVPAEPCEARPCPQPVPTCPPPPPPQLIRLCPTPPPTSSLRT